MQDSCRLLDGDKMVILVDEAGVCVGVGTPPTQSVGSLHASPADRARAALDKIVMSKNWSTMESKVIYADSMAGPPRSPHPLDLETKGNIRASKGDDKESSRLFQTYGYGLGDTQSKGMFDLKIPIKGNQIKLSKLQAFSDSWMTNISPLVPPFPSRDAHNREDLEGLTLLRNEITYYSKLSLWINKAFLPDSAKIALKAVDYLLASPSNLTWENLKKNIIK
ncbi:hypothetical protein KEM48_006610 [Puccinia striiformis f. sp. tritici PST-130]|nr:hypothetical protein KEM48_006610 [Puccinia striiformis f. sp. tritici PST-130]